MNKKILIVLLVSILLPFGMVRGPIEIASHVVPLWINYYVLVGFWAYTGKPFWQAFLASLGISSFGIIMLYCGIGWIQIILTWLKNKLRMGDKRKKLAEKKDYKSKRFTEWLRKQSIWVILLFLLIPFPYTDPAATVTMKLRETKHGLWYLLAINIPHVFIIVFLVYKGLMPYLMKLFPFLF